MMKWRVTQPDGRPMLCIGLEAGNVERLKRGEPIKFPGEKLEMPGFDIFIHYGDTKEKMVADIEEAGITVTQDMKDQIAAVDEAMAAVKDALAKAGLEAEVSFDQFSHTA